MQPLVIAYHLIWTVYGWWLPTDPQGSTSRCVRRNVSEEIGELHYGRKRVQPAGREIRAYYAEAHQKLAFPPLTFCADQVRCVAEADATAIEDSRYTCYACAIMSDHVHFVIRKHKHLAEEMIAKLQRVSHLALCEHGFRDMDHPVWGGHGWKVFLDHPADIWRTIGYVEKNPLEAGLPEQTWWFVTPYDNWPLHKGHDPNSPYARRLRGK